MGSGASAVAGEVPGSDLRLPTSGLRFTSNQLRALNSYVDSLYEDDQKGRLSTETECAVECLVQKIVDGAGQRDPRFRCCHLIALHRGKKLRSRSLEYLVTLDALSVLNESEECRLQDGPIGYGKIRLSGREADKWAEFLTPTGYLCRDKVVERWVELIARCGQARGVTSSRATCARAARRALPHTYCYLERASSQSSMERRLAIVEGAAWVMVRAGAGEAEAKLVLGARVAGCHPLAYTTRVPLTHPLALLHYTAAQGGYYAAAVGPPSSIVCGERSATWQLWHPALEAALDAHCDHLSTVARVAGALNNLLDKMREGYYQGSTHLLSRYAVSCALRRRLDRCAAYQQTPAKRFVSAHASHHFLLVLDSLLYACERGGPVGYVYPVERGAATRRGARDTDWGPDAVCIRSCLQQLNTVAASEEIPSTPSESLEAALLARWDGLSRESKAGPLTRRQLRYLWRLAHELVTCKNMVVHENHSTFRANLIQATSVNQEAIETLIHILAIMLDQARDLYLNNFHTRALGEFDRELSTYRSKKWNKLKAYYDASSACLIDAVRRDPDLRQENLKDETNIMKNILLWLQKGAKEDKKYLGPVLRPFLDNLLSSSIENSWFLEDFDSKKCESEFEGLEEYCMGVHEGNEPCMGLLDAAKKFAWAKALVDFVDRYRHVDFRLVFPTGDGMAVSYLVKLPSKREHSSARLLTLSRRDKAEAKIRLARRCVVGAFHTALVGERTYSKPIRRHESSDEILASVKTGNFWRNTTKPDIIPSTSIQDISTLDLPKVRRRSRRSRPATSYGFPEISITSQSDTKTIRRKYHTLKSLVYTEPVESIKETRQRPRSACSTVRNKDALSRPSILETLDFINGVKDALCVEESGVSDVEESAWGGEEEWVVCQRAPLNMLASMCGAHALHLTLADVVPALILRQKFSVLQELCARAGGCEGALLALHRLARAARSRSSERNTSSWKLPEVEGVVSEVRQKYKCRAPDDVSGDEAPQPPPLPRHTHTLNRYTDTTIHQEFIPELKPQTNCTGIINPIYGVKMPKDKFSVKRTKSLGRSFSSRNLGIEVTRYNLTLGHNKGKRTNDVVTAIDGTSADSGVDMKGFFQRYSRSNVVGDAYRISRVTID